MVLFTLLGVIALIQRERKKVNNTHSGQEEKADQSDVPPVRSCDGREIDDIGTVCATSDSAVDFFPASFGAASSCSNDVPQSTVCDPLDCSDDVPQSTVCARSDSAVEFSPASFGATSKCIDDVPQSTVCAASSCIDDVLQSTVCDQLDCTDDVPQSTVCDQLDCTDDVPQSTVCYQLDCTDDVPQSTVCDQLDCTDDVPQSTVCDQLDCTDDVPQSTVCDQLDCTDDVPQSTVCAASSCIDDVPQATVAAPFDSRDNVPQSTVCAVSSCGDGDHSAFVATSSKCSHYVSSAFFSATSRFSDDISFFTVTSRFSDDVSFFTVMSRFSDDVSFFSATSRFSDDVSFFSATSRLIDDVSFFSATSVLSDDVSFSPRLSDDISFFSATSKFSDDVSFFSATSKFSDDVSFFSATSKFSDDVSFFSATSKFSDDVSFFTATSRFSDDVSFFSATSRLMDDVSFFSTTSKFSDDVFFFTATSRFSDDMSFFTTTSRFSDDVSSDFFSIKSKLSDDVPPAFFSATSKCSDDVPLALFSATAKCSDDAPPVLFSVTSKSNDIPPGSFSVMSKSIDNIPPVLFSVTSRGSDDAPPVLFYVTSDCRDDALQASVRFVADLSVDIPQSPVHETLDCRVSVPEATACAAPDCSVDVPQTSACAAPDCSVDVPQTSACAAPDCSVDVPQTSACAAPDCSVDVPQAIVCQKEDTVPPQSSQLQDDETTIIDINSRHYEIGSQLGEGGFGTVYAATRLDDGLKVAIKFASSRKTKFISIDGYSKPLPLEVALLILANKGPEVQEINQLLDWQVAPDHYFMVLERPVPCQSLCDYLKCYEGTIGEDVVRVIMHQAIFAARMCCLRGVFHRDIKLENLLINPDTLEVKLIDFGCGAVLTDAGYTSFAGTREYSPPEYYMTGKYYAEPATVWSLGVLLFVILFCKFPKRRDLHKINDKNWTKAGLSKECCDFIRCCLQIDPKQRIELGKLSLHDWLMITDKQNNNSTIMDINSCRYVIDIQLGEGGFGTVYAATRLDDGQKVAIKFVSNSKTKFISINGYPKPLPMEVALQIMANQGPRIQEIVQLLDWRVEPDHYVLVLERPVPFEELNWFLLQQMVTIQEDVARIIMRQATFAAQTCCQRGVLHQDIKLENLLINPNTLEVKLTDFGCGEFLTGMGYTSFTGTREYCPPEYYMNGKYHGKPATVWSLGVLLFVMLCGDFPNRRDLRMINGDNWTKDGLSKECCDFIRCCLQIDPKQRTELEKLSLHNWFMIADWKK